jgi:hypothetical protein
LVVAYFFWPETKNISLDRLNKIFGEIDATELGTQAMGGESAVKATTMNAVFVDEKHTVADAHQEYA